MGVINTYAPLDAGLLAGIRRGALADAGSQIKMRPGCLHVLRRAAAAGIPTHVLTGKSGGGGGGVWGVGGGGEGAVWYGVGAGRWAAGIPTPPADRQERVGEGIGPWRQLFSGNRADSVVDLMCHVCRPAPPTPSTPRPCCCCCCCCCCSCSCCSQLVGGDGAGGAGAGRAACGGGRRGGGGGRRRHQRQRAPGHSDGACQ